MSSYNFCPRCGAKLMPDARFCVECGTPMDAYEVEEGPGRETESASGAGSAGAAKLVDAAEPAAAGGLAAGSAKSARGAATEAPDEGVSAETARVAAVADNAGDSAAENGQLASEGSRASSASSLTAAVESTKHRSRRRVPLVVLVALALALTSAVAFATYQVYTQVVAPAMQEQQATAPAQTGETGESEQNGEAEGQTDAEMIEKAEAAYQVVIDDYKSALADYAAEGSSYDKDAFSTKHPYIYADRLYDSYALDASQRQLSYSFTNFRENESPVLLVRSTPVKASENESGRYKTIVAAYVLTDGKPAIVAEGGHDGASLSLIDDKILFRNSIGSDQSGHGIHANLYFDISSQEGNVSEEATKLGTTGWMSNMSMVTIDETMLLTKEPSFIHTIGSIIYPRTTDAKEIIATHPDGSVTTTEGDPKSASVDVDNLKTECLSTRSEPLQLDWQPIS